ncbi:BTB/POZ domain-containing adapter for CUL3-mediated RhoA degradation protein 3 [Aplysia californica]|uniref:BTB/POZ domain-containing adapter for CUL3-mediated RhoA degradation protein 3 n=1 Tax=Aplysia californica TaxID=6500 RepID=A0ABM0JGJ3_APLCA|nr:BTB/POZ domain-containing adapter for CUL3-mediated RhoA degradation protein 3 [Aplysia californica]
MSGAASQALATQAVRAKSDSKYVKLNVGGTLHLSTIDTLCKQDTMLRAMFSGRMDVLHDVEGWVLIDRCGKHFGTILSYLRDGSIMLPESCRELNELLQEAKYYCVQELIRQVEEALSVRDPEPICQVPLITSSREEQMLIAKMTKPMVKLNCNRHNNKYSYTSMSDDNFLKNLELFDKLCLRFSTRILFVKDTLGNTEICCWSFYGHGQKIGEVCCTSIVYGTDKKHTKVDFPEARIFEETLNTLLYEHRGKGPDAELMQATRGYRDRGNGYHSDDEDEKFDRALRRK